MREDLVVADTGIFLQGKGAPVPEVEEVPGVNRIYPVRIRNNVQAVMEMVPSRFPESRCKRGVPEGPAEGQVRQRQDDDG